MGSTLRGMLWIFVMTAVVIIIIALVNRLPSLIHDDFIQRHAGIEKAERSLGTDYRIYIPSYFPTDISWPPSLILTQEKPYKAAVIEFADTERIKTVLVLIQSSLKDADPQLQRITMSEVLEKTGFSLKGRSAILQVGECGPGITCSSMKWQENGLYLTVLLMSPPFELIRVAESMLP